MQIRIVVQREDFSLADEYARLAEDASVGVIAAFVGRVRDLDLWVCKLKWPIRAIKTRSSIFRCCIRYLFQQISNLAVKDFTKFVDCF